MFVLCIFILFTHTMLYECIKYKLQLEPWGALCLALYFSSTFSILILDDNIGVANVDKEVTQLKRCV